MPFALRDYEAAPKIAQLATFPSSLPRSVVHLPDLCWVK